VYGAWEQYLGLEHTDTTPKRSYTANQVGSAGLSCKPRTVDVFSDSLCEACIYNQNRMVFSVYTILVFFKLFFLFHITLALRLQFESVRNGLFLVLYILLPVWAATP
jgi:hypothetical protein